MKPLTVCTAGSVATLAGAFIRSCYSAQDSLPSAWCGPAPHQLAHAAHTHCAGCALIVAGIVAIMAGVLSAARKQSAIRIRSKK